MKCSRFFSSTKCDLEDLNAFMSLQLAAMAGRVRQESLEIDKNVKFSRKKNNQFSSVIRLDKY